MRQALFLSSLGLAAALAFPAYASDLSVKEIRAYLFFSNTGVLSENIVGSKKDFDNTPTGDGEAGGAASNILVDIILSGQDPVPDGDKATLNITYSDRGTGKTLKRTFDSFFFGSNGVIHESVLVENATCWPVKIEATAGTSSKTVTLPFGCGE
jgi:hypothetical protein